MFDKHALGFVVHITKDVAGTPLGLCRAGGDGTTTGFVCKKPPLQEAYEDH